MDPSSTVSSYRAGAAPVAAPRGRAPVNERAESARPARNRFVSGFLFGCGFWLAGVLLCGVAAAAAVALQPLLMQR